MIFLSASSTIFFPFQALTISCVVLHYKSLGETDEMTVLLVAGTFVGYSIILIGLFAGKPFYNPLKSLPIIHALF